MKKGIKKTKLGKIQGKDYIYKASLDLTENDLMEQIEQWDNEDKIISKIRKENEKIKKVVGRFRKKSKNLKYYFAIGKKLQFLEQSPFINVAPHSVFRLLHEFLSSILPDINNTEVGQKHIRGMFYLGKIDKSDLSRTRWSQWYEMVKFPGLFTKKKLYKRVLTILKSKKLSGPKLREEIKILLNKKISKKT